MNLIISFQFFWSFLNFSHVLQWWQLDSFFVNQFVLLCTCIYSLVSLFFSYSESGEMCAMKEVTLFLDDAKSKESAKQLGQVSLFYLWSRSFLWDLCYNWILFILPFDYASWLLCCYDRKYLFWVGCGIRILYNIMEVKW